MKNIVPIYIIMAGAHVSSTCPTGCSVYKTAVCLLTEQCFMLCSQCAKTRLCCWSPKMYSDFCFSGTCCRMILLKFIFTLLHLDKVRLALHLVQKVFCVGSGY